jgi:hypothetical protein
LALMLIVVRALLGIAGATPVPVHRETRPYG